MSTSANDNLVDLVERSAAPAERGRHASAASRSAFSTRKRVPGPRSELETRVWEALRGVYDPEIPTISVVDLGIVHRAEATPERVRVEILPTFVGCPALDVMRDTIRERLEELQLAPEVSVGVTFAAQWTSDRITPAGHEALRRAGFAPPTDAPSFTADSVVDLNPLGALRPQLIPCPYCDSKSTMLENRFGPTLCRSIYYCNNCRQP